MFMSRDKNNTCVATLVICVAMFLALVPAGQSEESLKSDYDSEGRRDPFVPLVGVSQKDIVRRGVWNVLSVDDIFLQGIVINPDGTRSAVVNGEVIKEGESIDQVLIKTVGENNIIVEINGRLHELKLYEDN